MSNDTPNLGVLVGNINGVSIRVLESLPRHIVGLVSKHPQEMVYSFFHLADRTTLEEIGRITIPFEGFVSPEKAAFIAEDQIKRLVADWEKKHAEEQINPGDAIYLDDDGNPKKWRG